jgi:ribonuclease HI
MKKIVIHSDGACEPNPGTGGWAAVLQYGDRQREISGCEEDTTNNRMEIRAALEALRALKETCEVELYTDSAYLRDGITQWVPFWKKTGWRTREKKPVKNADLWRALEELTAKHVVKWHWLKGHAGHKMNERCDELASAEIRKLRGTVAAPVLANNSPQVVQLQLAQAGGNGQAGGANSREQSSHQPNHRGPNHALRQ